MSEVSLLAFLDGEAEDGVTDHLARCPHCRNRAAVLAADERPLHTLLFRITCPSSDAWRDFYFNLLPAETGESMAAHLHGCPYCTREMLILQAFAPLPQPEPAAEPVPVLWERLRWWVAQLLHAPPTPLTAGLRGSAAGDQQWLYHAGERHIGIDSHPDRAQPDRRVLVGALLAQETIGWQAHLWRDSHLVATTQVDDLGGFSFDGLLPADYELTLTGPDTCILLPGLTLH